MVKFNLNEFVLYDFKWCWCEVVFVNGLWDEILEYNKGIFYQILNGLRKFFVVWDIFYYILEV